MNTIDIAASDTEYIILENIYNSADRQIPIRQRDLAQIAGTSLGMTNSILKRLALKGWINVKKLNSRNIQYAITIEGINEIIQKSYRYFKRTIKNVVNYKDNLEEVLLLAKRRNFDTVILSGSSDLDFIVEHVCRHWGMAFKKTSEQGFTGEKIPAGTFIIYSENIPAGKFSAKTETNSLSDSFYLSRLIMKKAVQGLS